VGVDWFGRRSVDAVETGATPGRTLDGATEDEPSAFGTLEWAAGRVTLQGGARLVWNRQSNSGPSVSDSAGNGFAGVVVAVGAGVDLSVHLASGSRFPSLSERFFSGSTGRGSVIGNEDLSPETALNAEVGIRWTGRRATVAAYAFRNRVRDFIERIEVEPDVFTFVNIREGTISGLELETLVRPLDALRLTLAAAMAESENDAGGPLADVPSDRLTLGATWSRGAFDLGGEAQWRAAKDDPADGEKPTPRARLLSLSVGFTPGRGVRLFVAGANLLDESYFPSADEKVPLASGRGVQFGVQWMGGSPAEDRP
jgi:iron complex outermembrane receptor protein